MLFSFPRFFSCIALAAVAGMGFAQESAPPQQQLPTAVPKVHEAKAHEGKLPEKPSAVVQKRYRCQGGKTLQVRYQLGTRSVHAFAKLQGKMQELPWDGDYKLAHEDDERFSSAQYEMLVQGNFSRVSVVRRLPTKAGGKARELLRNCALPKAKKSKGANAGKSAGKRVDKNKADAQPTPVSASPTPTSFMQPDAGADQN
jgi:hypothetical protein